jgi:acyl dehydratase
MPQAVTEVEFPKTTDESVAALRARIGEVARRQQPHIEQVTRDAIRHWAMGIGDKNPLWLDPEYAKRSARGRLLAPPTILFAMDRILSGYIGGMPGVHGMFAWADFQFDRVIAEGDELTGETRLHDLIEHPSKFAGRSFEQIYQIVFRDQQGSTAATALMGAFRTERNAAQRRGKYKPDEIKIWTDDELEPIRKAYQDEEIRGGTPRYFSSVQVGDELPKIVRGPYTPTTAIAFVQGWGGLYVYAHHYAFDLFRRHPGLGIKNAQGVPEPPERVHWEHDMARAAGVPAAYDYGPERVAWMGNVVTNWMGDTGTLRRLRVEVRRHNLVGDVVWCGGTVTDVTPNDDGGIVTLELLGQNQRGELSAKGVAEVQLPGNTNGGVRR